MKNVYLVGPMGVGKTTVGKHLAKLLNYQFFDADLELENKTGASISWIFDREGEAGFRLREQKITNQLSQKNSIVLATGGGVVLSKVNRQVLKDTGYVVYLSASVETLLSRTAKDKNRPLLKTDNPEMVLKNILEFRHPLYQEISDFNVVSNENTAQEMANKIYKHFINHNKINS